MARKQHHLGMGRRKQREFWKQRETQVSQVSRELREQIEILRLKLRGQSMLLDFSVKDVLEPPELPELMALRNKLTELPKLTEQSKMKEMLEQMVLQKRRGPIRWKMKLNLKRMQLMALLTFKTESRGEDWTTTFGWFIPRKYRHVMGDILEDCVEMRESGCTEKRIKFHVLYQWLIAVITLVPTAIKASITDILKQVISPPK